jgi:hypothetical protein
MLKNYIVRLSQEERQTPRENLDKVSRPKSSAIAHRAIPIKPTVVQKTVFLDTFLGKLLD